jgi:hypothetical protein
MSKPIKDKDRQLPKLSDLFTPEQEAQLVQLLAELMLHKWGTLEIKIVNGKIRFFGPKPSIEAIAPTGNY